MTVSRREFMLAGLSVVAAGCATTRPTPGILWPDATPRPMPTGDGPGRAAKPSDSPQTRLPVTSRGTVDIGPLTAIARSRWAKGNPIHSRLNPLGHVSRITIHHEGHVSPVYFSDLATTADRMERIRKAHLERRFGDIGYHAVIDRNGRVWQGRSLRYQGAHVRDENEQNFGVMVLGNFDKQAPTRAQYDRLLDTVRQLMDHYDVSSRRVYTHRELGKTRCPGRHLQNQIIRWRRLQAFA